MQASGEHTQASSIYKIYELQIHSSIPFYTIYTLQNMLCLEAPEANILVCKGYKCTKNQAPNYILLQNQVISSRNYQQQHHTLSGRSNILGLIQQPYHTYEQYLQNLGFMHFQVQESSFMSSNTTIYIIHQSIHVLTAQTQ